MRAMLLASACAVAQVALALPAQAQTNESETEEIVVTAERRSTNLQQTAIAATVLTGDDLANAGVTTVDQLQFISPSATVNNFGQGIDFNIRGIGKAEHNTQTTTGVITYRDGVATFPGYFTAEPYYDISRVEILRGPQGTFVGQNATGGAVFVTSNNAEGHLRVRGAAVVERYFGDPESATDEEGWFATGDLAKIDGDGNLIITGRAKDLIKSGGEWINPAEIEAVVSALPEVSLAAVIGRQHPKWGERPILLVQTREQGMISDEALLAPLRDSMAPWWIPDAIIRIPQMPLAPTGKIDKIRLRVEYGG